MEPFEMPEPENLFLKAIWNNIIQIMAGLLVLVLIVIRWNSIESDARTGMILLIFVYFMIRFSVAYQSYKFEQDIEEQKKGKPDDDIYEEMLKEG
ncbi:MAG: hypothetical protein GPJ54_17950 [Candidatus Heimdallarchaeota archaeon]|nr:hypothetical protein [Candidatus Heimdallarchaeota archaeon]